MSKYILLTGVFLCCCLQVFSADLPVKIRGYHFSSREGKVRFQKENAALDFNEYTQKEIEISEDGFFETILMAGEPEFWTIEGVSIYIIPGESLDVVFDNTTGTYSFKGATKEECDFLNANQMHIYVSLSFLDEGKNVRESFEKTKLLVDSIAAEKLTVLNQTEGLDKNFVNVQKNRIQAHQVNSYLNYYLFTDEGKKYGLGDEYKTEPGRKFIENIRTLVEPAIRNLVADACIDQFDIRWVVDRCRQDSLAFFPEKSIWTEFYTLRDLLKKFDEGVSSELIAEAREKLTTLTCNDFVAILKPAVAKIEVLESGKPAIELTLQDMEGKQVNLSDFKGKLIYLDLWATWCGPCKREFPSFVMLKEKYQDVVFISVSIDERKAAWLKFMQTKEKTAVLQYHADRDLTLDQLIAWNISLIPRFILIDKDFKIVNSFAPRPSDSEIEPLLNKLLN
ncbi:redoxin family protein [Labilibaculum sp. A4]|uniref:TlpA family protein disulfide reductase n=1 Tax=Labilibaculum euxinus TaxID=2686357 RepID=UPI000F61C0B8|nr:TlpA disulfide reductase family protein [Labilibaculum euxinus]MDQ1770638.1 TlpA disulfide reductase family protein [Labilibaculum euxinus]MWN75142.1 redoxin family protein [Labilibaculum euxinus]